MRALIILLCGAITLFFLGHYCTKYYLESQLSTAGKSISTITLKDTSDLRKVTINTKGDHIELKGTVNTEQERERAEAIAKGEGFLTVDNNIQFSTTANSGINTAVNNSNALINKNNNDNIMHDELDNAPEPALTLDLNKQGVLSISGTVPNEKSAAALMQQSYDDFGIHNVETALLEHPFVQPEMIQAASVVLQQLAKFNHGHALIEPNTVTITGETSKPNISATKEALKSYLPNNYQVHVDLLPLQQNASQNNMSALHCQNQLNTVIKQQKILFRTNSSTLLKPSLSTLDKLTEISQACSNHHIVIEGHTDAIGDPSHNQKLSELRAQAVLDYLITRNVNAENFSIVGFGSSRPIADNAMAAGRTLNRRIEFNIKGV